MNIQRRAVRCENASLAIHKRNPLVYRFTRLIELIGRLLDWPCWNRSNQILNSQSGAQARARCLVLIFLANALYPWLNHRRELSPLSSNREQRKSRRIISVVDNSSLVKLPTAMPSSKTADSSDQCEHCHSTYSFMKKKVSLCWESLSELIDWSRKCVPCVVKVIAQRVRREKLKRRHRYVSVLCVSRSRMHRQGKSNCWTWKWSIFDRTCKRKTSLMRPVQRRRNWWTWSCDLDICPSSVWLLNSNLNCPERRPQRHNRAITQPEVSVISNTRWRPLPIRWTILLQMLLIQSLVWSIRATDQPPRRSPSAILVNHSTLISLLKHELLVLLKLLHRHHHRGLNQPQLPR